MAHKGILSKGIKLSIAKYSSGTVGTYTEIANVQKIPSLGGDYEKVEVTTLADASHQYIAGLIEYGDLEFTLLFDNAESTSNYRQCKDEFEPEDKVSVKVELGDALTASSGTGTTFTFDAQVTASLDEAEVNAPLTFTLKCALQSDISVANPT